MTKVILIILSIVLILFIIWCTCSARGNRLISSIKYKELKMPISQSLAKSHMNTLHSTLANCQIPFFLTEGTALGAIREQRVIPHDTDIDIGIDISYYNTFRECALPEFKKLGFKVAKDINKKNDTFITIIKNYLYIDIFFMRKDGLCVDIPCEQMKRYYDNRITAMVYDKEYDCLPVEYIQEVYGPDWKTPKRQKPG